MSSILPGILQMAAPRALRCNRIGEGFVAGADGNVRKYRQLGKSDIGTGPEGRLTRSASV
jgi:hypothetical protein